MNASLLRLANVVGVAILVTVASVRPDGTAGHVVCLVGGLVYGLSMARITQLARRAAVV